jgi:hypothetical protein
MKTVYYVGLDVHKEIIQIAVLGLKGKGPILTEAVANSAMTVVKVLALYLEGGVISGVCCALRLESQKGADQAIFYPANSESMPDNRDFCVTDDAKIHKCNRLPESLHPTSHNELSSSGFLSTF